MGIVYKWVDQSNNMYYIGSHQGTADDGYIGSGVHFIRAYSKRPELFSREIMYEGIYFRELEEFILQEFDCAHDPMSYNLKNSALGGDTGITPEGRKAISKARSGHKRTEEDKLRQSKSRKGKYLNGDNSRAKAVFCAYTNCTYDTISLAAKAIGISQPYCSMMLNGTKPNKYGLKTI